MKRRVMLAAALGIAAAGPLALQAQERQRRVGLVMNAVETDRAAQARRVDFAQALKDSGWTEGRNLHIDTRWSGPDLARARKDAIELVKLAPDVIVVGGGTNTVRAVQQATSTIPIIFTTATDPVGGGLVASLGRPGGNITGFSQRDFQLGAKSLELLKQLAPGVSRVAVLRDPASTGGAGQLGAIQAAAPSFRVQITPIDVRSADAIKRGLAGFAPGPDSGLLITTSSSAQAHRQAIISLAGEHRLPAVYPYRYFVDDGGLASYGPDMSASYRGAASYVDRILRGEKPADMPVQQPATFEFAINLKAARAIGLAVPQAVLLRADKVIE